MATQYVESEVLLPLVFEDAEKQTVGKLYEPNKDDIIKSLIPRHLNVQMWKYLLESYASEQAARMLAMENATENAQE
ncbi:MAG: FoF1 ATP synthase subunit gamma, partial [Candidatus Marinimicrobia bacterium]|nr:FoF1 ATP synthase subunit gamma [Candidatus Neomarinimicrobiota bacterium]